MTRSELIAACWTSAGACDPMSPLGDDRSPLPIERRVEAVSAAGFTGFGLRRSDLLDVRSGIDYPAFRRLLDSAGLTYLELEFLEGWHLDGEARRTSDDHRAQFLAAAAELGPLHIKVGGDFSGTRRFDAARVGEELGLLAAQAESAGTRIALEPMPFSDITTPQQALEAVVIADHPAAGICLDVWHVFRAGLPVTSVADLPGSAIFSVELDDAVTDVVGSLLSDTFNRRRFPGEGDIDIPGFVRAVRTTGFDGPWGVEMLSEDFRRLSVEEATRRSHDTASRFLDRPPADHPSATRHLDEGVSA